MPKKFSDFFSGLAEWPSGGDRAALARQSRGLDYNQQPITNNQQQITNNQQQITNNKYFLSANIYNIEHILCD